MIQFVYLYTNSYVGLMKEPLSDKIPDPYESTRISWSCWKTIKGNMAASMGASSQACEYLDLVHSVMEASRAGRDVRSRDGKPCEFIPKSSER